MKKSAFTLIELLVVISIIAVLASISIPVIGASLEHAHATADLQNLKQIGLGITQYLNDNENVMFPVAPTASSSNGSLMSWSQTLQSKYLPDWRVFRSPFDSRADSSIAPIPLSYGLNKNALAPASSAQSGPNTFNGDSGEFVSPSELLIMSTAPTSATNITFTNHTSDNTTITSLPATPLLGMYSKRRMVDVLYADAHVGAILWKDFSDSVSVPSGKQRWFPLGSGVANQNSGS